jgi:hypothetical protein
MSKLRVTLAGLIILFVGMVIGGYLFAHAQPRSVLSLDQCRKCLSAKDLGGLLTSAGIHRFPGLIPDVVFETDKTVAIKNPFVRSGVDYVILPKRDIKNIAELAESDAPYLIDAYLVARHLIEEKQLTGYRFFTNGPEYQDVTYLHFHLVVK